MSNYSKIAVIIGVIIFLEAVLIFFLLFNKKSTPSAIVTLTKGQEIAIPNSNVKVTLQEKFTPDANCNDCISTTTILVKVGNDVKTVEYTCGGFSGECTTSQEVGGVKIDIIDSENKDTIRIKVKKQ